jgi:hypothetical protein
LLPSQHFRFEIRLANFDDRYLVRVRLHIFDAISDSQTGRFALFLGKRGGRGRKVWTSGPNELTPSEPARRIFDSPAKTSRLVIIAGCLSSCRVVGFKPVFNMRTAGTNFTSPNSTIRILF